MKYNDIVKQEWVRATAKAGEESLSRHMELLEDVADAARVYMALWRRLVEDGVSFTLTAEGQALVDALNVLDKEE